MLTSATIPHVKGEHLVRHPDKNKDPSATDKFTKINEAYETLSDPERRSTYDKFGYTSAQEQWPRGPGPGFHSFGEFFQGGFGGFGPFGFDGRESGGMDKFLTTLQHYETKLHPSTSKNPCFIYAYTDLCFNCMRIEPVLFKFMTELENVAKDLMKANQDLTDQLSKCQESNSLQVEKLKSAEQDVQDLRQQLERERQLNDKLRSNNSELQLSNDKLMSDVQMLEKTLSLKSMDLDMSSAALDNLKERILSVYNNLQERLEFIVSSLKQSRGLEVQPDNSAREAFVTPNEPPRCFIEDFSLGTQILSLLKGRPPMPYSSTASFGNQGFSSSVKDEDDEARLKQNNVQFGALQPGLGAEAESYLSPGNQSFNRTCLDSDSMLAKVQMTDSFFSVMLRAADVAEGESDCTVKNLKEEITLLEGKLKFQRHQLATAESQLQGQALLLMALQDQDDLVTAQEEYKAESNRKVRALQEEVKLVSEQLNEVLEKCANVETRQKFDGASVWEIVNLKRKVKILDNNCKTAVAQVKNFDDLLEQIRETCVGSQAQSTHPVILQVVRLIDGVD